MESFFGFLQSLFEILRRKHRRWDGTDIVSISEACVIFHNMVVNVYDTDIFDSDYCKSPVTEFFGNNLVGVEAGKVEIMQNVVEKINAIFRQ